MLGEPVLTPQEIATFIIARWRIEHTPEAIMMALLMQRAPMTKDGILRVIRRYVDACTENSTYQATRRLG